MGLGLAVSLLVLVFILDLLSAAGLLHAALLLKCIVTRKLLFDVKAKAPVRSALAHKLSNPRTAECMSRVETDSAIVSACQSSARTIHDHA